MLAIVLVAGIIRGFTGFGSALLAVPALALLVGPAQAVVIEVLIEIPVVLGLMPTALRHAHRQTVAPMLSMCVAFVPFGALLLAVIDPRVVSVLMAVFVLCAVCLAFFLPRTILRAGSDPCCSTSAETACQRPCTVLQSTS